MGGAEEPCDNNNVSSSQWKRRKSIFMIYDFQVRGVSVSDYCVFGIFIRGKLLILAFIEELGCMFEKWETLKWLNVCKSKGCIYCKIKDVFNLEFEDVKWIYGYKGAKRADRSAEFIMGWNWGAHNGQNGLSSQENRKTIFHTDIMPATLNVFETKYHLS